jgi:hypothetical protein
MLPARKTPAELGNSELVHRAAQSSRSLRWDRDLAGDVRHACLPP